MDVDYEFSKELKVYKDIFFGIIKELEKKFKTKAVKVADKKEFYSLYLEENNFCFEIDFNLYIYEVVAAYKLYGKNAVEKMKDYFINRVYYEMTCMAYYGIEKGKEIEKNGVE